MTQHKVDKDRQRELIDAQNEPLSIRDRIHNQWEVLDLERRFAEGLEQSVRYALIVFGVTNTAAVLVLARTDILRAGSSPAAWSVRMVAALYTLLRQPGQLGDRVHSAQHVRHMGQRHDLGPRIQQALMNSRHASSRRKSARCGARN